MKRGPPQTIHLPDLPFGERLAVLSSDPKSYGDHVAAALPSLLAYQPIDNQKEFRTKSMALEINGLNLAAGATTPVAVEFGATTRSNILIPFFGISHSTAEKRHFGWNAGQNAIYLPAVERIVQGSKRAYLHIDIEPDRLQSSACAMLGLAHDKAVDFYLDQTRLLPLHSPNQDADKNWRQLGSMLDSMCEQPGLLAQLGIDELIYRNMVLMLRPDLFDKNPTRTEQKEMRVVSQRALDPLCSYIQSKLEQRITISDMERISGLSARALQYAFLQRYQCTPMHWVRNARLDRARDTLLHNDKGLTVGSVAAHLGFSKHSVFSAMFTARFGESPSALKSRTGKSQAVQLVTK